MITDPTAKEHFLEEAQSIIKYEIVCEAMLPWECTDKSHNILDRYAGSGFNYLSITVAADESVGDAAGDALRSIAALRSLLAERPEGYMLASGVDDIDAVGADGRLAISFNFQGTLPFGKSISLVPSFRDLGVRQVLLAYNQGNFVCDGCSERTDSGLTRFGISLVKALDSAGIVVDGTHCGRKSTFEAMEHVTGPFIFSHSNCFSVYPHYRNITDDQIKACAETGGFVGINGLNLFLGDEAGSSEAMFRHIDHVVNLVGADFAGIGFDYVQFEAAIDAYYERSPEAWPDNPFNGRAMKGIRSAQPEHIVKLVAQMLAHGYDRSSIAKILGGNYLRVAREVWRRG